MPHHFSSKHHDEYIILWLLKSFECSLCVHDVRVLLLCWFPFMRSFVNCENDETLFYNSSRRQFVQRIDLDREKQGKTESPKNWKFIWVVAGALRNVYARFARPNASQFNLHSFFAAAAVSQWGASLSAGMPSNRKRFKTKISWILARSSCAVPREWLLDIDFDVDVYGVCVCAEAWWKCEDELLISRFILY